MRRKAVTRASVLGGEHDGEDAGGDRGIGRIRRVELHLAIEIVDLEEDALALGFEDRAIMLAVRDRCPR